MSLWPKRLGGRIGVALAVAIVVIAVLALAVDAVDSRRQANRRVRPVDLPRENADGVVDRIPRPGRAITGLQPTTGTIALAQRLRSLSPDIAPVVEILPQGQVVLRRPPPLSDGPIATAPLSRAGHGAAVILPAGDLLALSPMARTALVSLLRRWVRERPVAAERLVAIDLQLAPGALRRLVSWIP